MSPTETLGLIGEMRAIELFLSHGWEVTIPVSRASEYDLAIHRGKKNFFIQCKYRRGNRGYVEIRNRRIIGRRQGIVEKPYRRVDYMTVYIPDIDEVLVIPLRKMRASMSIRLKSAGNFQKKGVWYAKNFINPRWILDEKKPVVDDS